MPENRPNPDALLTRIVQDEQKRKRGRFRLFFGMSAGVGKTYAMLKAAHDAKKDGIDVWIGVIETHGRPETLALTVNLPVIPKKQIDYRGTLQEEMDLDAILEKKPSLVLIDELAHTNIPNLRHEKRYQDVIEILDAGIDVYATMNVQHLESRADVVGLITATTVRETVPDSILDLADQIELIDITPQELIDRLKEGKIYPGRKTEQALQYFFQEGNLSALREISLRVTADKVERDMRDPRSAEQLRKNSSEKLLVAISASPFSEKLIRTARRIVDDLEMSWVAVYVDTGKILSAKDQNQLVKNLDLAREMGAETVTLHGVNIANTLSEYIKDQHVLQLIIGRPSHTKKIWNIFSSHFIDQIIKKNPDVDITILKPPTIKNKKQKSVPVFSVVFSGMSVLQSFFWVFFTAFVSYFLNDFLGYRAVGFLFLLLVIILSVSLPFLSVLLAATLSALIWNYAFIPPVGTFSIKAPEDAMMFGTYFVIALASGFLTFQLRKNQTILKVREEKTRALYDILKSMTLVKGTQPIVQLALSKIEKLFFAKCCVLLAKNDVLNTIPFLGDFDLTNNDRAVATWSYNHGKMAGWSTDTLPLSPVLCLALKSGDKKFGVLIFKPLIDKKLNPDEQSLLISIVNQIGVVLAKQTYDEESKEASLLKQSELLHQTLLNCVSHELRTPLTAIMGAATALQSQTNQTESSSYLLSQQIVLSSERLNRVFENLLDMTRLESGMIQLTREWFDLNELLSFTIDRQSRLLEDHRIVFDGSSLPIYFLGDYDLLEHALSNLLINAAKYSPIQTEILVRVFKQDQKCVIEVADQGAGIPEELIPYIFEKFYRAPGLSVGGLGLGLAIAKNLVELHQGTLTAKNRKEGGACFYIELPFNEPPLELQKELL